MILDFPPYVRPRPGPRRQRTEALVHRVVTRYRANWSLIDIGLEEGCGSSEVRSILVEAGETIRGRGTASDAFRYTADRRRAACGEAAA